MLKRILIGLVLALSPWLVLPGPDYHAPRSLQLGWQLGHVALFFAAASAYLLARAPARNRLLQFAFVICGAGLIGGAIELLQLFTQRDASWSDVRLDVCGAALAPALLARGVVLRERMVQWIAFATASVLLLALDLRPLALALADEYAAWRAFPVLSNFETAFQAGRWRTDGPARIVDDAERGSRVLTVTLQPGNFSGFHMLHFPRDWTGHTVLQLAVYRSPEAPAKLRCRVHDIAHDSDNRFVDRFNTRFELVPGWNTLTIPLDAVRSAPRGRPMDMEHIAGFGCFFVDLRHELEVRVDDVRLAGPTAPGP